MTRGAGLKVDVAAAQRLSAMGFDLAVAAEALRQVTPPSTPPPGHGLLQQSAPRVLENRSMSLGRGAQRTRPSAPRLGG